MGNVQLVRDAYDCFGRGDIPTLLGMMDPNIAVERSRGEPIPAERRGLEGTGRCPAEPVREDRGRL